MTTNQTEYTISNFTAVNDFIDEEKKYASHFRKFKIARLFKRYALYSSLLIVSLAILILFVGITYWLLQSKPNQIFKSTTTNITNYDLKNNLEELKKLVENNSSPNVTNEIINVEEEYVIFRRENFELENGDSSSVHTGWKFKPENLDFPYFQYCYLSLPSNVDSSISMTVVLMNKSGSDSLIETDFDNSIVGYYDFESAKSKCNFKY